MFRHFFTSFLYQRSHKLNFFLLLEPDSIILKTKWLKDIYSGWKDYDWPISGHLKRGRIKNEYIPTHWAGSSIYNSDMLRRHPSKRAKSS